MFENKQKIYLQVFNFHLRVQWFIDSNQAFGLILLINSAISNVEWVCCVGWVASDAHHSLYLVVLPISSLLSWKNGRSMDQYIGWDEGKVGTQVFACWLWLGIVLPISSPTQMQDQSVCAYNIVHDQS